MQLHRTRQIENPEQRRAFDIPPDEPHPILIAAGTRTGTRAVHELHDLALMAAGVHLGRGPWDADLDAIPATYVDTGGEFFLGTVGRRLVAISALRYINETDAEIKRIRVHPRFQRRGFAHAVLAQLKDSTRQRV
jgi:GNAT superfamily N-acetyltransferase